MKLSLLRAYWFYSVITLTSTISVFSQVGTKNESNEKTVKYVNGYTVITAERPPINLEFVSEDDYEAGKLFIKVKSGIEKSLGESIVFTRKTANFSTGVKSIDNLIKGFGVNQYKPILHDLYSNDPHTKTSKAKHDAWEFNLWYELTLDKHADIIKAVKEFSALDEVELAEPVYKKRLIEPIDVNIINTKKYENSFPNDPDFNEQWGFLNTGQLIAGVPGNAGVDINLIKAWEIETGNSNVIVSIHDGGVQYSHPDLAANMWSYIGPDGENTLEDDHGTHVAGTIAALTNNGVGVAGIAGGDGKDNGVKLMSIDIFNGSLSTYLGYIYAADNGAAISQNSWGYKSVDRYNEPDLLGIDYFNANGGGSALSGGGLVIFAAGNNNDNGKWYPAYYSGTISVASHDNLGRKSAFSNYGAWVDIAAPGTNIKSTSSGSQYELMSGTSMACPHVSGVAALILSKYYGDISKEQLVNAIIEGVNDIYTINSYYKDQLGSGSLNAYKAMMHAEKRYYPIVETKTVSNITSFEASSGGYIIDDRGYTILSKGVVWGKTNDPTLEECLGFTQDGSENYEYSSTITGLEQRSEYFVRAYAQNSQGLSYGQSIIFSTPKEVPFEVVDENKNHLSNAQININGDVKFTNDIGIANYYLPYGFYNYSISANGFESTRGSFTVDATEAKIKIILVSESTLINRVHGEVEVCIGSEVVYFTSTNELGKWEIQGGNLIGNNQNNSIIAKWNNIDDFGLVQYRIVDSEGFQKTYKKEVSINKDFIVLETDRPRVVLKGKIPILICTTPNKEYKWFKDGILIEGEFHQHFAPRGQVGRFQVQTTNNQNCPNTSSDSWVMTSSSKQSLVSTFPNPNKGQFTINYQSESVGAGTITVSNAQGKVVYQESFVKSTEEFSNQLSLSGLPKGIYIVTITAGNEVPVNTKITIY